MSELKCQFADCDQRPTMHVTCVEDRRVLRALDFCDLHGRSHFNDQQESYYSTSRVGSGIPLVMGSGVAFDIDFLFCDELLDQPWGRHYIQLIETGGHRQLGFVAGSCECSALNRELHRFQSPRPLTYQAMARAISALGGQLQYIEIDKFFPAQQIYEAKLHIRQMNTNAVVDIRPSDALVLALICDVPIIVSDSVLRAIANAGQG